MNAFKCSVILVFAVASTTTGCAISSDYDEQRRAKEEDIAQILNVRLDPAIYGETKRCLRDREYRTFRALDDQRILFSGRKDKLWINSLRNRCPDLRYGDVLVVRSFSSSQLCDMDRFEATDWFQWPWYRRWPWHWGNAWGSGPICTLGKFQPVTKAQLTEIEAIINSR